nr:zinc finger, CCHC-type [Tanacetum cinerariifolium]GEZ57165.1 zinc finger, CCHC-type [Tanacetum cinerariifolium]
PWMLGGCWELTGKVVGVVWRWWSGEKWRRWGFKGWREKRVNRARLKWEGRRQVTNVISLINLRVVFHAIDARRLPLAPLVYTLMTTSSANNSVFRGFFEKQKLTGPNFIDWYRQLRIVLSIEDKLNYIEQPIPPAPVVPVGQHVAPEILAAYTAWIKGSKEIAGLMLMTMEPEI